MTLTCIVITNTSGVLLLGRYWGESVRSWGSEVDFGVSPAERALLTRCAIRPRVQHYERNGREGCGL